MADYPTTVLGHNPVGYWRMSDQAGAVVTDHSGDDRHGFAFGLGLTDLAIASAAAASTLSGQPASYMLDGNTSTFYCADSPTAGNPPQYVEFTLTTPDDAQALTITMRDLLIGQRSPKDFTIDGWDGATWTTLRTFTNVVWSNAEKVLQFVNATTYSKYRLRWTSLNGGMSAETYVQIHTATVKGPTTSTATDGLVPSESDDAATFNGTTQWAEVPYDAAFDLTTEFSLEAWVVTDVATPSTTATIMSRRGYNGANTTQSWELRLDVNRKLQLVLVAGTTVYTAQSDVALAAGTAYHVVATFDNGAVEIYVDAVATTVTGTIPSTVNSTTSPLHIGAFYGNDNSTSYHWDGTLDDLSYYPTALSADDVAELYDVGVNGDPGVPSGLDLSEVHKATITIGGMEPVTELYATDDPWVLADGWDNGGDAENMVTPGYLDVLDPGDVGYLRRVFTPDVGSGDTLRVRALVRLRDPEDRPARMWIADQSGAPDVNSPGRLVSGSLVVLEGLLAIAGATAVRIYVERPAGAAGVYTEIVSGRFDRVVDPYWTLTRVDTNGTRVIATAQTHDPDDSGTLVIVDREASLVGETTWTLRDFFGSTTQEFAGQLLYTGYGVLQRVHDPASVMHEVFVRDFRQGNEPAAEALLPLGAELAVVPTRPLAPQTGILVGFFPTLDAANLVADDLRTGVVHMLRQPIAGQTAMDTYLVPQRVDVSQTSEATTTSGANAWALTCTYVETDRGA